MTGSKYFAEYRRVALAVIVLTSLAVGNAQNTSSQLAASERMAALAAIKEAFQKSYVFPAMRPKIIEHLNQRARGGRYDVSDPVVFSERITEDLQAVAGDKHLSLTANATAYAAALKPPRSDSGSEALSRRQAIRRHHGLGEMKLLPGNIRYLKITGFEWVPDVTGAAYDDAIRFLRDGDALIIDLRDNGGGAHPAVRYLVSHFMNDDVPLITFLEGSEPPMPSRTLEHLPAGRLKGKPLYVLINNRVASAAEEFACHVQQFKLGTLVGSTTAGAANNNKFIPIAPGFLLSVSYGRPEHAISGANWEGTGIAPAVAASAGEELDAAQSLALQHLSQLPAVPAEQLAEYSWARIGVEARLHPVSLSATRRNELAGTYGDIKVESRDQNLWLHRPNRPAARLTALTADGLFSIQGSDVLRVRLTGKTIELLFPGAQEPRVFARD